MQDYIYDKNNNLKQDIKEINEDRNKYIGFLEYINLISRGNKKNNYGI